MQLFVAIAAGLLAIVALLPLPLPALPLLTAEGASFTWTGNAYDQQWNSASNWSPQGVPSAADDEASLSSDKVGYIHLPAAIAIRRLSVTIKAADMTLDGASTSFLFDTLFVTYSNPSGGRLWLNNMLITVASAFEVTATTSVTPAAKNTLVVSQLTIGPSCAASITLMASQINAPVELTGGTFTVLGLLRIDNLLRFDSVTAVFANSSTLTIGSDNAQLLIGPYTAAAFSAQSRIQLAAGIANPRPITATGSPCELRLGDGVRLPVPLVLLDAQLYVSAVVQIDHLTMAGSSQIYGSVTTVIDPDSGVRTDTTSNLQVLTLMMDFSSTYASGLLQTMTLNVSDSFAIQTGIAASHSFHLSDSRLFLSADSTTTIGRAGSAAGAAPEVAITYSSSTSTAVFAGALSINSTRLKLDLPATFTNSSSTIFASGTASLHIGGQATFDSLSRFQLESNVTMEQPAIVVNRDRGLSLLSAFCLDAGIPVLAQYDGVLMVADNVRIASPVSMTSGPSSSITGLTTSSMDPISGVVTIHRPTLQLHTLLVNMQESWQVSLKSIVVQLAKTFTVLATAVPPATTLYPTELSLNNAQLLIADGSTTTFAQVGPGVTHPVEFRNGAGASSVTFAGATSINFKGSVRLQLSATFTNSSRTTFGSSLARLEVDASILAVTFDTLSGFQIAAGVVNSLPILHVAGNLHLRPGFQLLDPAVVLTLQYGGDLWMHDQVQVAHVAVVPALRSGGALRGFSNASATIDRLSIDCSRAVDRASLELHLDSIHLNIRSGFSMAGLNSVSPGSVLVWLSDGAHLTLAETSEISIVSSGPGTSPPITISADTTSRLSVLGPLNYSARTGSLSLLGDRVEFADSAQQQLPQLRQIGTGPFVLSPPTVTSVTPLVGAPSTALTLTLTGTGFRHPGSMIVQYGPTSGPWRPCTSTAVLNSTALLCAIGADVGDQSSVAFAIVYTDTYNTPSSQVTTTGGSFTGGRLAVSGCEVLSVSGGSPGSCATTKLHGETCSITCDAPYTLAGAAELFCQGTQFLGTQFCAINNGDDSTVGLLGPLSPLASYIVFAGIGLFVLLFIVCIVWRCRRKRKDELEREALDFTDAAAAVAAGRVDSPTHLLPLATPSPDFGVAVYPLSPSGTARRSPLASTAGEVEMTKQVVVAVHYDNGHDTTERVLPSCSIDAAAEYAVDHQTAEKADLLSGVADATRALAIVTGPFGVIFGLISTLCSMASSAQLSHGNARLLARRCEALRSVLQSIQQHMMRKCERFGPQACAPMLPALDRVLAEFQKSHALLARFTRQGRVAAAINAGEVKKEFVLQDSQLTAAVQDLQVAIQTAGLDQGDRVLDQNYAILSQLRSSLPYCEQMMEDLLLKVGQLLEQNNGAAADTAAQSPAGAAPADAIPHSDDDAIELRLERLLASSGASPADVALASQTFQCQARIMALAGVDNRSELRTVEQLHKAEITAARASMMMMSTASRAEGEMAASTSTAASSTPLQSASSNSAPDAASGAAIGAGGGGGLDRLHLLVRRTFEIEPGDVELCELIGMGAFGEVYRALFRKGEVAVKKLNAVRAADEHQMVAFQHEIAMLCSIRHPSLLMIQGACMNKNDPFIVTEYCSNGSLADLLKKSARARADPPSSASSTLSPRSLQLPLSNATRLSIGVQILEGLVRLHESSPPIIHRDLKTANILLDQRMNAKIADFGLAQTVHLSAGATTRVTTSPKAGGTFCYMSPELLGDDPCDASAASDMYASGVVLWELWSESVPWSGLTVHQIMRAVGDRQRQLHIPDSMPPKVAQLVRQLFDADPAKRPSAAHALEQIKHAESEEIQQLHRH